MSRSAKNGSPKIGRVRAHIKEPSEIQVIHVCPHAGLGGIQRVATTFCREMPSQTTGLIIPRPGPIARWMQGSSVPLAYRMAADRTEVERCLDAADVVHIHAGRNPRTYEPALELASRWKKPFVMTLHGERVMPQLGGALVCCSPTVARMQTRNRTYWIPNAVPTAPYPPRRARRQERRLVLLRLHNGDQFEAEVFERLAASFPDRLEFWLLGKGSMVPPSYPMMQFGWQVDVRPFLEGADLLIHPVKPKRGAHDMAVLEAMAAGVVPLVSPVESASLSITHGFDGLVCGRSDDYLTAVEEFLTDPGRLEAMAYHAWLTARYRYNISQTLDQYRRVYALELALREHPVQAEAASAL